MSAPDFAASLAAFFDEQHYGLCPHAADDDHPPFACFECPTTAKLLAIGVAVMTRCDEFDHVAWTMEQVKEGPWGPPPIIAQLRAVQP